MTLSFIAADEFTIIFIYISTCGQSWGCLHYIYGSEDMAIFVDQRYKER